MKHLVGIFATLMAIIICFAIIPDGAQAQIFDQDLNFLKEKVLPIAKQKNHQALLNFINVVLPQLNNMIKEDSFNLKYGLNKVSDNQIIQKDIMLFAYNKVRVKVGTPFGFWHEVIKENIFFMLELICPIKEFLNLKPEEYESKMSKINLMLVDGSYAGTLKWLSLLPYFYDVRVETVRRNKKFPEIEDLVIIPLLEFANKQKVQR